MYGASPYEQMTPSPLKQELQSRIDNYKPPAFNLDNASPLKPSQDISANRSNKYSALNGSPLVRRNRTPEKTNIPNKFASELP